MNLQESIRRILKEETEDGIKNILFDIFNENTKGAEFYEHDNSLWMVLPEQEEWVFEIDKNLTLWYNYKFFKKFYKYASLDVIDNQHYITEWVENIIKIRIRDTQKYGFGSRTSVEDIIKKGKKG